MNPNSSSVSLEIKAYIDISIHVSLLQSLLVVNVTLRLPAFSPVPVSASQLEISISDGSAIQRLDRSEVVDQRNRVSIVALARISHQGVESCKLSL